MVGNIKTLPTLHGFFGGQHKDVTHPTIDQNNFKDNTMKSLFSIPTLFVISIAVFSVVQVEAHPGDTDTKGCHLDQETEEEHCHEASTDSATTGGASDTSTSADDASPVTEAASTPSTTTDSTSGTSTLNNAVSTQGYDNGYNAGLAEGMALCKKSPGACGISSTLNTERTEEEIKEECRSYPESCGIKRGPNDDGSIQDGIAQCQNDPQSCGIEINQNTDGSTTQGIAQCQNDPKSCGIETNQNTDGSTSQGIAQCQNDPKSCGLEINQNTDGSTLEGITQCQNDPSSCGITITQNTDGSTIEGIRQCQNDPLSCEIIVNPNLNKIIQETKAQCQREPASCGIDINNCPTSVPDQPASLVKVHGFFSLSDGKLYLPAVDVPTALDGTVTTYEIELKIIPGREPLSFVITKGAPIEGQSKTCFYPKD